MSSCFNVIGKDPFAGVQLTGVANYATAITGTQLSGVLNVAGRMNHGAQITGVANVNGKTELSGTQISGVVNLQAGDLNGAQISGVINTAKSVNGVQIGTINVAKKVKGVQIGVINVSDENDGLTIGLLSFVRKNPPKAQVWVDEMGFVNAGIRTGTQYSYSYLGLGARRSDGQNYWTPVYGLGFRKPFKKTFIGVDFLGKRIYKGLTLRNDYAFYHSVYRVIAGYKLFEHLTVWGGPTLNNIYTHNTINFKIPSWADTYGDHYKVWPGFVLGVEF